MVELRKRPAPPAAPPPAKKKAAAKKNAKKAVEEPVAEEPAAEPTDNGAAESAAKDAVAETAKKATKGAPAKQGDTIDLEDFGGEVDTNDGQKTTLAKLVQSSKAGVVLFTYPKASTPGCKRIVIANLEDSKLIAIQARHKHVCSATRTRLSQRLALLSMD